MELVESVHAAQLPSALQNRHAVHKANEKLFTIASRLQIMAASTRASARIFWILMDSSLLLDFLEAKDIINALHACHEKLMDQPIVFYKWVYPRLVDAWPALPLAPPVEYLHPRVLLKLLEQVHVITTYTFPMHLNPSRCGNKIRMVPYEYGVRCRTAVHGSVYGDRECTPNAVSYWECRGITMGCYVGVAQELDAAFFQRFGFYFGRNFDARPEVLLSKKVRVCDLLPAIMYGQTGEITTGEFRGPRLELPGGLRAMQATPINPDDVVGICVDLAQGQLLFFLNGFLQSRIALDRGRRYIPVVSFQNSASSLFIHQHARPPWAVIYDYATFRDDAQYLALQRRGAQQKQPAHPPNYDQRQAYAA